MSSFGRAARDPVFWLHHTNIDRLWEAWLAQGGGRSNPSLPQGDPWLNQAFTFFDENGKTVRLTGADIRNTMDQLDYRYNDPPDRSPDQPGRSKDRPEIGKERKPRQPRVLAEKEMNSIALRDQPISVAVKLAQEGADIKGDLVLRLEGVEIEEMPVGHYEVYVNLPEGERPNFKSVYYVGNMSFFGLSPKRERTAADKEAMQGVYTYNLTKLERRLKGTKQWTGEIKVTFVKVGPEPPPGFEMRREKAKPAVAHIGRVKITRGRR